LFAGLQRRPSAPRHENDFKEETMDLINSKWLLILAGASAWTIFFSMFNTPGVRGWRNLGWLGCFMLGAIMLFALPWRSALATWALAGVASGLFYLAYELFAYAQAKDKSQVSKPNPMAVVHGLFMWPIMLPEAVEYLMADLGVLKAPEKPET
jgi:hypothetical protein